VNIETLFPRPNHDHERCVASILADAEALCRAREARLTPQRRRILEIVARRHDATGAYEIIDRLAEEGKRPAPITVYRALDFLIEHGLVHRLASLNAYIACQRPGVEHRALFLICAGCNMIGEMTNSGVAAAITGAAADVGFTISTPVVEVTGLCQACRHRSHGSPTDDDDQR
jgi:Fur family zinc uptake transcriptional regulator